MDQCWYRVHGGMAAGVLLSYTHGFTAHSSAGVAIWFGAGIAVSSLFAKILLRISAISQVKRRLRSYYEGRMSRLEGRWSGTGDSGDEFFEAEHPYSADLDVLGEGSLFEYLCSAQTGTGRECLARWLLSPASVEEVLARQEAVDELRERDGLREYFATARRNPNLNFHEASFRQWLSDEARPFPTAIRLLGGGVCLLNLSVLALSMAGLVPANYPLASLAAVGVFTALFQRRVSQVMKATGVPRYELELIAQYATRLRQEKFHSPLLARLQIAVSTPAPKELHTLLRLMRCMSWHEDTAFTVLSYITLWGAQFAMAVENRRLQMCGELADMAADIGRLEALCSLSAFAVEHPDYSFPVFEQMADSSEVPVFEGGALGHPLIAAATCVRNPVSLNEHNRFVLVSGSNMSGKSTYLRAIGLNYVLARAGAPVCAESLRLSVFFLAASMRVEDSLQDGKSRFFAEVSRVKNILEWAAGNPLLFLLDELLSGTNSADRRAGVTGVIRRLVERGASGLLTSHDLALAEIVDSYPGHARNAHFVDQFAEDRMAFDYRIRDGVVPRSNGRAILSSLGIL